MGLLDKMKGWLSGRREEPKVKVTPEPPTHERKVTIYEEEEDFSKPPKIDEYVDIEFTKPKKRYGRKPTRGITMVKKKTTRRKTTRKKTAKKKTTRRKTTRRKTTKKKTTRRKTTRRKTAKRTAKRKTTRRTSSSSKRKSSSSRRKRR